KPQRQTVAATPRPAAAVFARTATARWLAISSSARIARSNGIGCCGTWIITAATAATCWTTTANGKRPARDALIRDPSFASGETERRKEESTWPSRKRRPRSPPPTWISRFGRNVKQPKGKGKGRKRRGRRGRYKKGQFGS